MDEIGDNVLKALHGYGEEALSWRSLIEDLEGQLKEAKAAYRELTLKKMPELLDESGVDSFTMDGFVFRVGDRFEGTLPTDEIKRHNAITYLEEHGGEGLVNAVISLTFPKAEREEARRIAERIQGELGVRPELKEDVHHMSLKAFIRQRIEEGDDIDPEQLGVQHMREVKMRRNQ